MKNFNADKAREIVNQYYDDSLNKILMDIKKEAEKGCYAHYVYEHLNLTVRSELEERGFEVTTHPSIAIQRDNLYHTIHWSEH